MQIKWDAYAYAYIHDSIHDLEQTTAFSDCISVISLEKWTQQEALIALLEENNKSRAFGIALNCCIKKWSVSESLRRECIEFLISGG
jgi:hypothetical protein